MKKTILTLCIGMMIGMLVGTTSGVFAALGDTVEGVVAEYTILVDGEEQVLETSPVAINDSTYIPLRAMANMLGKDVTYKADSRTIELNTPLVGGTGMIYIEPTAEEKKMTPDEIKWEIDRRNNIIRGYLVIIGSTEDPTLIAEYEAQVTQWKAEIVDLEAQKTLLAQ